MSAPVLTIADLSVIRPSFRVELPELRLDPGDVAALVGRSGSGKSTLLRAIVGPSLRRHDAPEVTGRIGVQGRDWPPARDRDWREALRVSLAWLPQDPVAALDPVARIGVQLERLCGRVGTPALVEALARLGVDQPEAILRRYPHQISGGEAQRVWLASAWLRRPALLLADEPTASLDGLRIGEWVQALGALRDQVGCAAVVATHDLDLVDSLAARPFVAQPLANTSGFVFEPGDVGKPEWPVRSASESPVEPAVLELDGVSVRVGRAQLIEGIDLEVRPGESVAIQGPSGAGKTTVAKVLAAHLAPTTGRRRFDGPRTGVQLLFQNAYQSLTPGRTIRWLVEEVATPTFDVEGVAAAIGLADRLDVDRESLSGGERRRAALLRCLAVQPRVLVLDEPTASLDHDSAAEVVRAVLDQQAATGMALVWITHDAALARCVADRFLSMLGGRMMCPAST